MKKYLIALMSLPLVLFASEELEFAQIKESYQNKSWNKVISTSNDLFTKYPKSIFLKEAHFFRGVAYFKLDDPDLANKELTTFLETKGSSRHFEEAIHYKYFIAEKFENGHYGHLFGVSALPRMESMWDTAYQLYDEVAMVLPRSEIAAKATFRKAQMMVKDEHFEEAIETYNTIIRRFSNLSLAQESFVEIAKVYKAKIKSDYLDPKCYEFALINEKKFLATYPNSKWRVAMEEAVMEVIDMFAEDMFKSALYYDKKEQTQSAIMYLKALISKYPKSKYAVRASEKILDYSVESLADGAVNDDASELIGSQ